MGRFGKRVLAASLLAATIWVSPIEVAPVSAAEEAVVLEWSTPNNTTVSGTYLIEASARTAATGSATIKKWCLTIDGVAASTDSGVNDATYSKAGNYGSFDNTTGCWSSSSYDLTTAQFQWDSTAWANGSHTYVVTVTDTSNRTATSTTLTVNIVSVPAALSPSASTPAVRWSTVDGENVTGTFSLSATAAGSTSPASTIKKWCLTVDGSPVTSDVSSGGSVGGYSTFNADTGCWSNGYGTNLTSATFAWDSTSWANGSHTYVVTVTDTSNRTATSTTLTVNTYNYGPHAAWSTVDSQTVTGTYSISAVARPQAFGTATIKKWCLTVDGSPVTSDVSSGGSVGGYSTFNADTGCWSNRYGTNLTSATFQLRTAAWTNKTRTAIVTVTDTSNRTASSSLAFATSNPQPATSISGITTGQTVTGVVTFTYRIAHPGASKISTWCFRVNGGSCDAGSDEEYSSTTSTTSRSIELDTGMWKNGSYSLSATATDSEGRAFETGTVTFNTNNQGAKATTPRVKSGTPRWSDKTVTASVWTTVANATSMKVRWGTSARMPSSAGALVSTGDRSFKLKSLRPGTRYYVQISVTGPNGTSTTKSSSFVTAKIPPKPVVPKYSGGSGGSGGSYVRIPNVIGWNLQTAYDYMRSLGITPILKDYCGSWFGIINKSNWFVYRQFSSILYACQY